MVLSLPNPAQQKEKFIIQHLRNRWTDKSTMGTLVADSCTYYSLEDPICSDTPPFVAGLYPLRLANSPRLSRSSRSKLLQLGNDSTVIWIDDVPGHKDLQIHPGNDQSNTDGCILPGMRSGSDRVAYSIPAFIAIRKAVREAIVAGKTAWIDIKEEGRPKVKEAK